MVLKVTHAGSSYYKVTPSPGSKTTTFKPGVFYPCRVATQFKKGNFLGKPSKEEWSKGFKKTVTEHKERKALKRRREIIIKEAKEIQDIARSGAVDALKAIKRIVNSKVASDQAVIQAATVLLDRGYGKATQTNVNSNVNIDAKPNEISAVELDQRIASALKRVEDLTKRVGKTEPSKDRPTNLREYN